MTKKICRAEKNRVGDNGCEIASLKKRRNGSPPEDGRKNRHPVLSLFFLWGQSTPSSHTHGMFAICTAASTVRSKFVDDSRIRAGEEGDNNPAV